MSDYDEGFEHIMKKEKIMNEFIEKVKVLELRPGQILVVKYDGFLTLEAQERITSKLKQKFPDNQVMILEGGLDIGVIDCIPLMFKEQKRKKWNRLPQTKEEWDEYMGSIGASIEIKEKR
jgi:hypothetical protein